MHVDRGKHHRMLQTSWRYVWRGILDLALDCDPQTSPSRSKTAIKTATSTLAGALIGAPAATSIWTKTASAAPALSFTPPCIDAALLVERLVLKTSRARDAHSEVICPDQTFSASPQHVI
ncbi:hypothetical protein FVE85_2231 [Porphyridium purpureum]|uniref:Uncharacterized protein n=1 Tax=Porphyridium purpureum TaxID=35688 RepID=A0A5J4YXK2_PORPP|nr:hypothetical protein FVE85_2231 [Porphyridium purpureum]|eukprot:POR3138..scf209_3